MGNNKKRSFQNVQLFIEVPKSIYQAGQTIQGKIHLSTQTQKLPYQKLLLGFYCRQTYLLKASKQKQSSYQTTDKFLYQKDQIVHDFTVCQLSKGQYSFPFQIKLPQNCPTSFNISGKSGLKDTDPHKIQIRYALKAQLSGNIIPNPSYGNITKVHYLNIIKPFKLSIQPLNIKKSQEGKSCLCFGNFTTQVSMYVDKNYVFNGDKLQINGQVDNMHGGRDLQGLTCQLFQRNIVTNENKLFYKEKQRGVLHIVKNFRIKKGNVQNFSFSYKIPQYLEHSHSIGNYSALIYFLRFEYQFKDGCDPQRVMQLPLHIETKTPKLEVNIDEIPSSYEWNPTENQIIKIQTDGQFVYNKEYPLQKYRVQLQKNKIAIPSFQYFNKMNEGYLTKELTPRSIAKQKPQQNSSLPNSSVIKYEQNPTGRQLNSKNNQNQP